MMANDQDAAASFYLYRDRRNVIRDFSTQGQ